MGTGVVCQAVHVATGSADNEGFLVFVDDVLAAVFVRLEDQAHGPLRGQWFLETGFGRYQVKSPPVFEKIDEAQKWVLKRSGPSAH
jgi:hypothetical protein